MPLSAGPILEYSSYMCAIICYTAATDNRLIIMYLTITATSNKLTLAAGKSQGNTQNTAVKLFVLINT